MANLPRKDGQDYFEVLEKLNIETRIERFPLSEANKALQALKEGRLDRVAVLEIGTE